ncbi:MAG: HD domain-containing protein [Bacilli bacterium]|nr:HD domain-containing protein [Bacilli bacterium]
MDERIKEAMRFYLMATKLKDKIRSGWDNHHWNIKGDRVESVAEHVYGSCILAISLNSEFDLGVNMEKVLKTLVIHEIGEVLIGDITPFDNITPEQKQEMEHRAMQAVLGDLCEKDELYALLLEFDEHKTKESRFAYFCDKIEADIQSKIYQDKGCHHPLSEQSHNAAFRYSKTQDMITNGAKEPFDIWYEWDKSRFEGEPIFQKVLEYVKENNTNI